MKKYKTMVFFALVVFAAPLAACHIEFEPAELSARKGETVVVTVVLELEHRRCELTLEDTQYEANGLEIVKMGEWESVDRFTYRQELTLKLTADKGVLRVMRECTRKGVSEGVLTVTARE